MACSLSLISVFNGTKSNGRASKSDAIMFCLSVRVRDNCDGGDLWEKKSSKKCYME